MSAYAYTYGGPAAFLGLVLLVALPALYVGVLRRSAASMQARLAAMLLAWLLAVVVAYADVVTIARRAARLCATEGGLRVHRTAVTAGFLGDTDFAHWSAAGFDFVEWRRHDGTLVRYTAYGAAPVREPRSRHELVLESAAAGPRVRRLRWAVRALGVAEDGGQALGTYTQFEIGPGWLDRLLIAAAGLPWAPPNCAGAGAAAVAALAHGRRALVTAVLRPLGSEPP